MIYKSLFLIVLSTAALAFDKDFKAINDRVPLEFNYLFESMKISLKSPLEQTQLVAICKDLDENLGLLQKEHIFLLIKSEVIKNVLEHKFKKVRSFDVTISLISRLEEDLSKKQNLLTPFSQWIWRSLLAELKFRQNLGLITARSFNANNFKENKAAEAQRFSRYLTYLLPWIDKMDSLNAAEFNELSKQVSWTILRRLNERSLLFKRFASSSTSATKITLFNIPAKLLEVHPEDFKRMRDAPTDLTLKEESQKEKSEATKQIQNTTVDDLSPISNELSDELSKELEQKSP